MSDLVERLRQGSDDLIAEGLMEMAAARIKALEAALRRIDAINDSPARFSADINDVCRAMIEPNEWDELLR